MFSDQDPESGIAGAPDREEEADVGTADFTVSAEVFGAARTGTPRGEDGTEVGTVDLTVVVEVAFAGRRRVAAITVDGDVGLVVAETDVGQRAEVVATAADVTLGTVGVGEDDDLPLPDPDDNLCSSV